MRSTTGEASPVTSRDQIASDIAKLGAPSHWLPKSKVYVCEIEAKGSVLGTCLEQEQYSIYIAISKYQYDSNTSRDSRQ
jgi:hypothetical protein